GAMSERWDVGRALALAALFRLLQGAGRGCAEPFLPLYLRLLGLPAPLLGAAAGARLLAALAVPLCCPRGRAGRLPLLLTAGSAPGSVGASLALTLIPPAGHTGHTGCSLQLGLPGARPAPLPSGLPSALPSPVPSPVPGPVPRPVPTAVPGPVPSPGRSSDRVLNPSAPPHTRAVPGRGTARDVATPGTERALLALLRALGTAGAGLGSLGAGFVVQHLGLPVLLQASCVGLGIWTLFFLIVRSRLPQQRKLNYSQLLAADSSEMSDSEEESEDWLVKAMKDESFNRNWIQQHGIN
uniref:Uncharacterized protein n=1 Tax=Geospiza parvula TaxID=87175 RepID=A0A8U8AXK7_GEOPR